MSNVYSRYGSGGKFCQSSRRFAGKWLLVLAWGLLLCIHVEPQIAQAVDWDTKKKQQDDAWEKQVQHSREEWARKRKDLDVAWATKQRELLARFKSRKEAMEMIWGNLKSESVFKPTEYEPSKKVEMDVETGRVSVTVAELGNGGESRSKDFAHEAMRDAIENVSKAELPQQSQIPWENIDKFISQATNVESKESKGLPDGSKIQYTQITMAPGRSIYELTASGNGEPSTPIAPNSGSQASGWVIDARHLPYRPTMHIYLKTRSGEVLFGPTTIDRASIGSGGMCGWSTSLDEASKSARVTPKPIVVRPERLDGRNEFVIPEKDALGLAASDPDKSIIRKGKVQLVVKGG